MVLAFRGYAKVLNVDLHAAVPRLGKAYKREPPQQFVVVNVLCSDLMLSKANVNSSSPVRLIVSSRLAGAEQLRAVSRRVGGATRGCARSHQGACAGRSSWQELGGAVSALAKQARSFAQLCHRLLGNAL